MEDDRSQESLARTLLAGVGVAGVVTAIGLVSDIGQLLSLRAAVLIVAVAATVLAATIVAIFVNRPLGPGLLAGGLTVTVLATCVLSIAVYRGWIAAPATPAPPPTASLPPWRQQAGPAQLTIPFGRGDKLPQGSLMLDPPGLGPDAYHGDVEIQCETDGKAETEQNCTGADVRTWIAIPINQQALVGAAFGDAFTDPGACDEGKGVTYEAEYLELTAGRTYCLRKRGDLAHLVTLRVVALSTAQPLPTNAVVETVVWSR